LPMILWGEIREFPLFTVLQFLAEQRITGVLEIQDFEELGAIYLVRGRIEAISTAAADEMLGNRLVAAGALTESQVKDCWMQSGESEGDSPVPARLLEAAMGAQKALEDIVQRHAVDQVMQLMYWNAGTFRLSLPPVQPRFAVVPPADVEQLLLEAYRRVDEGERPYREKALTEEELCATCTIECSPAIKQRFLKPDVCLWRNMPSILKESIYRVQRERTLSFAEDEIDELPFI
jgi:hypothetical protein